jgi:hypothetical protein
LQRERADARVLQRLQHDGGAAMNEPIRQEVLEKIAKNGVAYTNEVKQIARELIELRQKQSVPFVDPYDIYNVP